MVYHLLGSQWFSGFLGWVNYDFPLGQNISGIRRFLKNCAIDLNECLHKPEKLDTARKVFERRIRYWQCRPICDDRSTVVSPADARLVFGSFKNTSNLLLKGKFFDYEELLGPAKTRWLEAFRGGDFVICRLTPDKYHYNHTPVPGAVRDFYENDGAYHFCTPAAALTLATPYSKNKRVVTIIDTDVPGGSAVGLVAMVEIDRRPDDRRHRSVLQRRAIPRPARGRTGHDHPARLSQKPLPSRQQPHGFALSRGPRRICRRPVAQSLPRRR